LLLLLIALSLCSNYTKASDLSLGTVIINAAPEAYSTEPGASFSSIIKKDDISASDDIPTLIEKETSVQVRQSGGLGSFSSVSLRGSSSNQVMVFLDGVPLNDSTGGGVDLSSIPYSEVSSIEIYRGNTPSTFGRGGMGGAINIKTMKAVEGISGNIESSYSSFNTFKLAPTISQKTGKFDYLINTEYLSSKNNFGFLNDKGTQYNTNDDKWEQRNNSQFWHANVLANAGYDISKDVRAEFSEQYFGKDQNLASQNNSPLTKAKLSTARNIVNLKMNYFNSSSRLDYTYKKEYYDDKNGTLSLGKQYNRYITNNYGYNQLFETTWKQQVLDLIFDIHREQYNTSDLFKIKPDTNSSRNIYTASAEDKIVFFSESLMIVPALTFEYYDTDISDNNTKHDNGYLNPKLGVKYQLNKNIGFKSNIARYTREPSFFELIGDRGYFVGNSDLKAERGTNFDIGTELRSGGLRLELAYFRNMIKDVISYVYDSSGIGHALNISESTISGVETTLEFNFLKYFCLNANYTWQLPVNQSKIAVYDGKKLPGRFENSFFSRLQAKYWRLKPYYEFTYEDGLYYDSANLLPAPPKREHNIGVAVNVQKWTFIGEIKNLTNSFYEDFNGYPRPGRSYWLTANYSF